MIPGVTRLLLPMPAPVPTHASRPFHIMTKPIGPICNLGCTYCFYLEKEALYEDGKWRMAPDLLESYIRQYIEAQPTDFVSFAWQGGEPTLLGVEFFRRVVALQREYADGKTIENAFQTNGTLLDDAWGTFLKESDFLVGISIDGPRELHDRYRVDKQGRSSFDQVMRGVEVLKRHEVAFNTLTCLNRATSKKPLEVYRFLKDIGSTFLQFIPIIERRPDATARQCGLDLAAPPERGALQVGEQLPVFGWSVLPQDFGDFYIRLFDRWVRKDVGKVYVQFFDTALGKWVGAPGGICVHNETCGDALAIEHNGDVYSCDHFVYPAHKLGNLREQSLPDLVNDPRQRAFGAAKSECLPRYCRECPVRFACHGGCPKYRFLTTPHCDPGLHYLCAGYRAFFQHVAPVMDAMATLWRRGQPPAAVMGMVRNKKLPGYRPRA